VSWVYLSPHFDDVALSCGGLVWEQVRAGESVSILTICAGKPPPGTLSPFAQSLHARWQADQKAPARRKSEDIKSCHILGAGYRHFTIPDCIYRRHPATHEYMYASEESLNGPLHPGEASLIQHLRRQLRRLLAPGTSLVCPLALGNHVDHQLTRLAAEGLGYELRYYADFPYVLRDGTLLERMEQAGWTWQTFPVSATGLQAWQASIAAHASQISTFWAGKPEMEQAVKDYWLQYGGIRLWMKPGG